MKTPALHPGPAPLIVEPADRHLGYAARSFLASPAPTGPLPAPQFSPADYWAYGVGSGLEFKY